jgi:hypothetical protein
MSNLEESSEFQPAALDADRLTWSVLLGRWVEFARSAVVLPTEGEAGKLKACIPPIIGLQAVIFALTQLDDLPTEERELGRDRAAILIERHRQEIESQWPDHVWPDAIGELIEDAGHALKQASGQADPA